MKRPLCFVSIILITVSMIGLGVVPRSPVDYRDWDGQTVTLTGRVVGKEIKNSGQKETMIITIETIKATEAVRIKEAMKGIKATAVTESPPTDRQQSAMESPPPSGGKILCYLAADSVVPYLGSIVSVRGKLSGFEQASNPGQFSAADYYRILKTDFRLYETKITAAGQSYSRYREALYQIKTVLGQTLDRYFSATDASVMRTMLLGESGQTDPEIKRLYQRNGIVHILAISGLHISLIGMGIYRLLRKVALPVPIVVPLALAVMYSYGVMTNMGTSSIRAIMMFGMRLIAQLLGRTYDLLIALALAAMLLLLEQPLYLNHSGFLFSFLAVLAIGLFIPAMNERPPDKAPADGSEEMAQQNTVQKTQPNVTQRIGQNIARVIQQGVTQAIQQEVTQAIQQEVTQAIQQGVTQAIQQEITQAIQQEITQEMRHRIPREIGQAIPERLGQGMRQKLPKRLPVPPKSSMIVPAVSWAIDHDKSSISNKNLNIPNKNMSNSTLYLFKAFSKPHSIIGMVFNQKGQRRRKKRISPFDGVLKALGSGVCLSAVTLPVYLIFYYQFPLYSIVLNLLVIPLMGLVMLAGMVTMTIGMVLPWAGGLTAMVPTAILAIYEAVCRLGDRLPGNNLILGRPEGWQVVIYGVLLLLLMVAHRRLPRAIRYLILTAGVVLLVFRSPSGLTVTFLDVGQGDCIFIQSPEGHNYLIDSGSSSEPAVGEYRILPYLKYLGVRRLDALFITHPDRDHCSAFAELAAFMATDGVPVTALILPGIAEEDKDEDYRALEQTAREAGIALDYITAGMGMDEGDFKLTALHPGLKTAAADSNGYSTVLYLKYRDFSALFTGDIAKAEEVKIMEEMAELSGEEGGRELEAAGGGAGIISPRLTVLKVAHHGSRYSSHQEFLQQIGSVMAVISAGRGNQYGHPHTEVLDRLERLGTKIYITYETGAVTVKTDGKRLTVTTKIKTAR